jgi:hypothetical protein
MYFYHIKQCWESSFRKETCFYYWLLLLKRNSFSFLVPVEKKGERSHSFTFFLYDLSYCCQWYFFVDNLLTSNNRLIFFSVPFLTSNSLNPDSTLKFRFSIIDPPPKGVHPLVTPLISQFYNRGLYYHIISCTLYANLELIKIKY